MHAVGCAICSKLCDFWLSICVFSAVEMRIQFVHQQFEGPFAFLAFHTHPLPSPMVGFVQKVMYLVAFRISFCCSLQTHRCRTHLQAAASAAEFLRLDVSMTHSMARWVPPPNAR